MHIIFIFHENTLNDYLNKRSNALSIIHSTTHYSICLIFYSTYYFRRNLIANPVNHPIFIFVSDSTSLFLRFRSFIALTLRRNNRTIIIHPFYPSCLYFFPICTSLTLLCLGSIDLYLVYLVVRNVCMFVLVLRFPLAS